MVLVMYVLKNDNYKNLLLDLKHMDILKRKRTQELEKQLAELQTRLRELEREREQLNRVSAGFERTSSSLQQKIRDLEIQNREVSGSNAQLKAQLGAAQEDLAKLKREREEALSKLNEMHKAEERSKEIVRKLIVNEQELANLIKKTKLVAIVIMRTLKSVMDRYSFLRYHSLRSPREEHELRNKIMYPNRGNYSKAQVEEAIKRQVPADSTGGLPSADKMLQESLAALLRVINLFNEIGKLINEELVRTVTMKKVDQYVEKIVLRDYDAIYKEYIQYKDSFKFEERIIQGLKQGYMEEKQLELINAQIVKMIREVIVLLRFVNKNLSSRAIGIFFPEFDRIQLGLKTKLDRLFGLVIDTINQNEQLTQALLDLNDKDIENAQKEFNRFLINRIEAYGEAIRKAEKRDK